MKIEWWGREDEFVWEGMPTEMIFDYTHIRYNEETKQYEEVKREVTISTRQ